MNHGISCNSDYISPIFARTKFGRNFMRIGVSNINQVPMDERNNKASFESNSVQNQQEVLKKRLYNRSKSQTILRANEQSPYQANGSIYRNWIAPKSKRNLKKKQNELNIVQTTRLSLKEKQYNSKIKHLRELNWNNRFHIEPMPEYDSTKDIHVERFDKFSISKNGNRKRSSFEKQRYVTQDKPESVNEYLSAPSKKSERVLSPLYSMKKSIQDEDIMGAFQTNVTKSQYNDNSDLLAKMSDNCGINSLIEKDMFLEKLKNRLKVLWKDLHISKKERRAFYGQYLENSTKDSILIVIQEIQKLTEYRANTILVLKHISEREGLLASLQHLVFKFGNADLSKEKPFITREIKDLLTTIRISTLEVVESIDKWRKVMNHQKPFIWQKQNYLLKIIEDLKFFVESPLSQLINKATNLYRNAFMNPSQKFGINKIDNPNDGELLNGLETKYQGDRTDQNGNLPLLKSSSNNSEIFRERIIRAQEIIFKEFVSSSKSKVVVRSSEKCKEHTQEGKELKRNNNKKNEKERNLALLILAMFQMKYAMEEYRSKMLQLRNVQLSMKETQKAQGNETYMIGERYHDAAICIQKQFRMFRARMIVKELKVSTKKEILSLAEKEREEYEGTEVNSAIQACMGAILPSKKEAHSQEISNMLAKEIESAVLIQKHWRGLLDRRRFFRLKEIHDSELRRQNEEGRRQYTSN